MRKLRIDPDFNKLLPVLNVDEYKDLTKSLLTNGFDEKKYGAIIVWGDTIIDGHNRYKICQAHDIEPVLEQIEFANKDEAIDWIINNQFSRRNLTDEQRDYLRGVQYNREKGKRGGDHKSKCQNGTSTADKLAEQYNVSPRTIKRDGEYANAIDKIAAIAGEEIKQDILAGQNDLSKENIIDIGKKAPEEIKEALRNPNIQKPESVNRVSRIEVIMEPHDYNYIQNCSEIFCPSRNKYSYCKRLAPFEDISSPFINFDGEKPIVHANMDNIMVKCSNGECRATSTSISPKQYFEILFNICNDYDKQDLFDYLNKELEVFRPESEQFESPDKQVTNSETYCN